MAGERPAISIKGRLKSGAGKAFDIGAAWPSKNGIGFNFQLGKDVELFVAGVKVTGGQGGDCWFNLYDNRPSAAEQDPQTGAVSPRSSYGLSGGGSAKHTTPPERETPPVDDDIPF